MSSTLYSDSTIFEDLIEKTSSEAMRTLVDEIPNHVESVIDAKAEAKLIINRAESVATNDTNSPITSLSSPVRITVSSPSVDSIYRISAVQIPHFDGLAAEKIGVLEITADNYLIAWKTSVECYDNSLLFINRHVRAILVGPPIDSELLLSLIAAPDTLTANYRALVATNRVFVDQFAIAAHLLRVDLATRLQWEQRKAAAEKCKGRPYELLHVEEAVAEGATQVIDVPIFTLKQPAENGGRIESFIITSCNESVALATNFAKRNSYAMRDPFGRSQIS
ncbi:hypothetical protein M0804_013315 [Polistes exclamans]|nr:hypothetical protein M0804_013315 [Polistes exclamans]